MFGSLSLAPAVYDQAQYQEQDGGEYVKGGNHTDECVLDAIAAGKVVKVEQRRDLEGIEDSYKLCWHHCGTYNGWINWTTGLHAHLFVHVS